MTIYISDRVAPVLLEALIARKFVANTPLEQRAQHVANYLRGTKQSVARSGQHIPSWERCFVSGDLENCRAYELRPSDDVEHENKQALSPQPLQTSIPTWGDLSGRLVGYDAEKFNDFESARMANALHVSASIQPFSFSSVAALLSLRDILALAQTNAMTPLTMGFVSPELIFISVDELIFRSELFPKVAPSRLLQGNGLPDAIVHITLRDTAGNTQGFAYPPFSGVNEDTTKNVLEGHTTKATIQSVLTNKPDFVLSGDQWRALDSALGGLATFIARVHLHNQSPEEALAAMNIN